MPIAKLGMLFMKKLAKCSAATTTSASGPGGLEALAHVVERGIKPSRTSGSACSARPTMPGAWLQTPAKTRLTSVVCSVGAVTAAGVRVGALVAGHRVDALADRAVGRDARRA